MVSSVLNNTCCSNDAEETLEYVTEDCRHDGVSPPTDTGGGGGGRGALVVSIVGDNIIT